MLACLRHGGRSATDHPGRQRGRHLLVIAQTAMALVLLVGSGLLARSFARLMQSDQGFVAENVLTFRVALPERTYPKGAEVVRVTSQLVDRLAELPSVEAAGATTDLPMIGQSQGTAFEFDGARPKPDACRRSSTIRRSRRASSGRCASRPARIGLRLERPARRRRTIIVNKAAADQYWPGEEAVGKRVRAAGSSPADCAPGPRCEASSPTCASAGCATSPGRRSTSR